MSPKDFLSIAEVSEQTGIPLTTLRHYRAHDIGPESYRIAGRVMYPRDSVERWIAAQMAESVRGGR